MVSSGVGYPALRQTPYVALVVPAYGEICGMGRLCRNFNRKSRTLIPFWEKGYNFRSGPDIRVMSGISRGFASGFGKFG
ncbi:Disease resistance protein TIR-NBS-LRR class family, partial [Prunus dulcis]